MEYSPILLVTMNAKYIHSAFGLRYLKANLGPLEAECQIHEFEISEEPHRIVAELLAAGVPKIVGFGVYIWNIEQTTRVVQILKALHPELVIVVGGPEVSYESEKAEIVSLADFCVCGEADHAFRELCQKILEGNPPAQKIIQAQLPQVKDLALPYRLYSDKDLSQRILYVEASRGCPFTCEFCLSSLDIPVRAVPLETLFAAFEDLLKRGARQFKFVDRTFNLNIRTTTAILQFFLDRLQSDLFLHFEMVPDHLPEKLAQLLTKFPPGMVQLEVGIQTFNPTVAALISRKQDYEKTVANIKWLRANSGVHLHVDLIVGLPGEDEASFAAGFSRLYEANPQEIQVGILKKLKGTPIARHDQTWQMRYAPFPPYEILSNSLLDFTTIQRLRRFARFWDLVANSGNFPQMLAAIMEKGPSPYERFAHLAEWLYARLQTKHGIAFQRLAQSLARYAFEELQFSVSVIESLIGADFARLGRGDVKTLFEQSQKIAPLQHRSRQEKHIS